MPSPGPSVGRAYADRIPALEWALLTAPAAPDLTLLCELGESAPVHTQGYGGWDEVPIPGDIALSVWRGVSGTGYDLQLVLDQHRAGTSVNDAMEVLEAMAGRGPRRLGDRNGGVIEPPILRIDTRGRMLHDVVAFPQERWVIIDIDWDEAEAIVNSDGHYTRAHATVSIRQHNATIAFDHRVTVIKTVTSHRKSATAGRYTTKTGDTLVSIARAKLHDPGRWTEIAGLNKIRDPRAKLKTGTHLRLP